MKIHPFTRPTIVAAIELLAEVLTQAKFDQLVVRLALDNEIPQGTGKSASAKSVVLARIVNQRATQIVLTLDGSVTLAEATVREAVGVISPQRPTAEQERFQRGLALDGYVVSWNDAAPLPLLRPALPAEVDLPAADDEVHQLLRHFNFADPLGHLDQAIEAHTRGDWAAANSQIRTFLESLLNDIALLIDPQTAALASSDNRRSWLADRGFLSRSRNEYTNDGKNYLNGLFKMLHTEGSHPGLSDEDHSTFRLHLGLVTGRILLRRLKNNR